MKNQLIFIKYISKEECHLIKNNMLIKVNIIILLDT